MRICNLKNPLMCGDEHCTFLLVSVSDVVVLTFNLCPLDGAGAGRVQGGGVGGEQGGHSHLPLPQCADGQASGPH